MCSCSFEYSHLMSLPIRTQLCIITQNTPRDYSHQRVSAQFLAHLAFQIQYFFGRLLEHLVRSRFSSFYQLSFKVRQIMHLLNMLAAMISNFILRVSGNVFSGSCLVNLVMLVSILFFSLETILRCSVIIVEHAIGRILNSCVELICVIHCQQFHLLSRNSVCRRPINKRLDSCCCSAVSRHISCGHHFGLFCGMCLEPSNDFPSKTTQSNN